MTDEVYDDVLQITHNILNSSRNNLGFIFTNYTNYEIYNLNDEDWILMHHVCRMVYDTRNKYEYILYDE